MEINFEAIEAMSLVDIGEAIILIEELNSSPLLFNTSYENDGSSFPREVKGSRRSYAVPPEVTGALINARNKRLRNLWVD